MGADHRNPKAKPIAKPKTGNARRGNPKAQEQARENLKKTAEIVKKSVSSRGKQTPTASTYKPKTFKAPSTKVPDEQKGFVPFYKRNTASNKPVSNPAKIYRFNPYEESVKTQEAWKRVEERKKKEEAQYRQSLEGQIEAEIESVTTTSRNTPKYEYYQKLMNDYWNDYVYNVDQDEFREWYDNNVIHTGRFNEVTGQYEDDTPTIKVGAPPPPLGTDKDGNTVDITDAWEYCQAYDIAINKYIDEQQKYQKSIENGTATMIAGQDNTSPDSLMDVFRAGLNPNESGRKALKDYVKGYIVNPFVNKDYKELAINQLWNLGETMDFFAVGVRAAAAAPDVIGSFTSKPGFEGQGEWWYDDEHHIEQKRLVSLGADKLLTGSVKSKDDYDTGGSEHHKFSNTETKEDIENKIKEAGLWNEYLDMKSSWDQHQQEFRVDNKVLQNIKSAYTNPGANFNADTGNLASDIAVEVLLDPTLVAGGAARGFAKTSARATSELAVRSIAKNFATATVTEEGNRAAQQAIKQFIKNNSENLLTKNHNKIKEDIKVLGDQLESSGAINRKLGQVDSTGHWANFDDELAKEIFASIDSTNYKIVRSMHNASELMDKADSILLKSVFALPYIPIKGGIRGYRGARTEISRLVSTAKHRKELFGEELKGLPKALDNIITKISKRNQYDEIVARNQYGKIQSKARSLKPISLGDIEKMYSDMAKQPSSEVWDKADEFLQLTQDLSTAMNKPLADFRDGKITAAQYAEAVDEQIAKLSGVARTRSELNAYLEDLYKNAPQDDYGRIGKIYDDLKTQLNEIDSIHKQLLDREVEMFAKELKGIKTVEDLALFSEHYFRRSAEQALPEAFEEALRAKQLELAGQLSDKDVEKVLRNLERNQNISIDLNPRDADIPLPESVVTSKKFGTTISEKTSAKVKKLQIYFTKEKHDWSGLSKVRQYMYSISNVADMPPQALHDVLRKGITELMLRKNMGGQIDDTLYATMIDIDKELYDDALSIENITGKNVDYNAIHLDHLTVFDEYMNDPRFKKILSTLQDPNTAIGKMLSDVRHNRLSSVEYENNPVYEMLKQINDLLDMNNAYFKFRNAISDSVANLTDRQVYAVLDKVFGITKGSPKDFLNKALSSPQKFMQDLETLLVAEYGQVKCSLDSARVQIGQFDEELFKDYSKEIEDPEIQKRLINIVKPGHIDPMNDVRVQMLYTILRDKSIIDDYNAMSKNEREVIFSDIETTGFNRDYNGLTSIAFKRWKLLDDNPSLEKILDAIEDPKTETLFKRSLSDDELKRIDDGLLNSLFEKHPTLANTDRETKLAAYKEFYAEAADGKTIFSSEEDMMKFINQYITNHSVIKSRKWRYMKVNDRAVPCLVFHNANGFDTKFLTARMRNLKVGIPKGAVEHISDIERYSHNTLARLRALEGDVILTYEQKQFVLDHVIKLAREMNKYDNGFKFLDPRSLEIALYDLQKLTDPESMVSVSNYKPFRPRTVEDAEEALAEADYNEFLASVKDAQIEQETLKPSNVSVDKYSKDSLEAKLGVPNSDKTQDDVFKALNSAELKKLRQNLRLVCQDVGHMQNRYEKYIIQKIQSVGDDLATAKTYSNLMREAQQIVPDRSWSYLSYDVAFRGREAAKFFNWDMAKKITTDELHQMKRFTDWINNRMQYHLRSGADEYIEQYEDFFRSIIDDAIKAAQDIDQFNQYSYLRFLKQPSTPMEAYLMAQKLYDDIFKYYDEDYEKLYSPKREYFESEEDFQTALNTVNTLTKDYLAGKRDSGFTHFMQVRTIAADGKFAPSLSQIDADGLAFLKDEKAHAYVFNDVLGDPEHYVNTLRTPQQQAVSELKKKRLMLNKRIDTFVRQASLINSSEFANIVTIKIQTAYEHLNKVISELSLMADKESPEHLFWRSYIHFKNTLNSKRMELFDAYRLNRMLRDAEGNVSSNEQLISEILFSNGLRKVIPRAGTDLHVTQVNELVSRIESLKTKYLLMHDEGDHIVIAVNPKYKPVFRRNEDGIVIAKFPDSSTEYKMMEEEKLDFPDFEDLMEDFEELSKEDREYKLLESIYEDLKLVYDDFDDLTDGASRGTLGIMASYNKELKLSSSFLTKTLQDTLSMDYIGDSRILDSHSFDKSILGDFEHSWKLSSVEDDFDLVQNAANVLDELSGRVMSERHYIDTFFGDRSPCKIADLGMNFSNTELLTMFKGSDEYVCVSLHSANTKTGFEIRQMNISDELSVEVAKRNGAIYIPYDLYLDMSDVINNSEITNKFLKLWSKFAVALKVTQLVHPGTMIRNWIDATMRLAADEGSLGIALGYELIAAKRLMDVQRIIRDEGPEITEAIWRASNYDRYMSYADYMDLVGFKSNGAVSGGESARSKRIIQEYFERGQRDEALGIDGFNSIGKDEQRFEQAYTLDELDKLMKKEYEKDPSLYSHMTQEDFIELFIARQTDQNFKFASSEEQWYYNEIANKLIDRATKNIKHPITTMNRKFDQVAGWMLTPMSQTELIVRYSQLLALRDLGYTNASVYKHIIDTHFNYNNKSARMKCLEAVIPYATFQFNNLIYWIRQIDRNPRMIRWIEETFGKLSFAGIENLEDDNGNIDQSLEYRIANGGIPLGSDGLYFRLNPSYMDAINWFYGGPDDFLAKVLPPIRSLSKASILALGYDSYGIFDSMQFSHSAKEWMYELAESVPGANYVGGFVRHIVDYKQWERLDKPLQQALVEYLPSLFGAVKSYNRSFTGDFEAWQNSLAKDGKWYDSEKGRVVDISEKNEEGLNNPDLSFEDRRILEFLLKGRLYDQNQGRFVDQDHFIHGGLNRVWDFSKEGEWEKYCELKKKYLGLEYDLNTRTFVYNKSVGGLNAKDLDWDTICDLNAEHGIYWDANQGRFVEEKYLTQGGFNKESLSFPEQCVYQLTVKGKIWDPSAHAFVDTDFEPVVAIKANNKYNDWRIFDNMGFNPTNLIDDNATYMENGMLRSIDGKYVLSNDQISNDLIFKELMAKYSYNTYGRYFRRYGYHRGWRKFPKYHNTEMVPNAKTKLSSIQRPGFAYTSAKSYASLRMAVAGYKSYDDYYKFEFQYNYDYHAPTVIHDTVKRYDYYRPDHQMVSDKFRYYRR